MPGIRNKDKNWEQVRLPKNNTLKKEKKTFVIVQIAKKKSSNWDK